MVDSSTLSILEGSGGKDIKGYKPMLTNYKNKVMTPNTKDSKFCQVCGKSWWKKIIRNSKVFMVCKECGHVKKG